MPSTSLASVFPVLLLFSAPIFAAMPADVLPVTAAVDPLASPHIRLGWTLSSGTGSPTTTLWRREKGSSEWGGSIQLAAGSTSYADATAVPGIVYEYALQTSGGSPTQTGAIAAGCNIPLVETRGNLLLYVDQTQAAPLAPELARLARDLAADGWVVHRHDGPREVYPATSTNPAHHAGRKAEREAMRAVIKARHDLEPSANWALLIVGRAPVAYSGLISPDGHSDHFGAWPTDSYYADPVGLWTDVSANSTTASDPRNRNIPGDGKFDQSTHPGNLVFQTGRIDLSQMNTVPAGLGETALLRQHLVRNHRFRRGLAPYENIARRALIDSGFASLNLSASAWRFGTALFGRGSGFVDELDWFSTLRTTPFLLAYGEGGGTYISAGGIGSSQDFAEENSRAVFNITYGSYFGDWDVPGNFLRAPLAGTPGSLGLVNLWTPSAQLQHMALGETIGHAVRFTQNNTESRGGWLNGGRSISRNLMGDPTLRLHPVRPPSHVVASSGLEGVSLRWVPSPDASGYHVYRSLSETGPFVRMTGTVATGSAPLGAPVQADSYFDATAVSGQNYTYLVKAVRMESSASGTYANQSLGEAVSVKHSVICPPAVAAPTGLVATAQGATIRTLQWRDNAFGETGYEIERFVPSAGEWTTLASLAADTESFTDLTAPPGSPVHYRVRAAAAQGNSPWAAAAADYSLPGVAQPASAHVVADRREASVTLAVDRRHGAVGQAAVSHSTADLDARAGTDYVASSGVLDWNHGDDSRRSHSVAFSQGAPGLTRFFRVNYAAPTNGLALGSPASVLVQAYDPAARLLPGWSSRIIAPASEPAPWAGYAEYHDGTFGLSARTGNVGTGLTFDSMRFLYLPVTGDCRLTVRLHSVSTELSPAPRAGIMIRASLEPTAMIKGIHAASGSVAETRRMTPGAALQSTVIGGQSMPHWLRLSREGGVIRAYRSDDGATWTQLGSDNTPSLSGVAYVGMFVASNTQGEGLPAYVKFDQVSLETSTLALSARSGPSAGRISLSWTAAPGALSYELQRDSGDGAGFVSIAHPAASTAAHADAGLTPGVTYRYRIRSLGPTGLSNWSATVVALPYLPSGIDGWSYLHFGDSPLPAIAGKLADPDGDGRPNLLEYALGSSPINGSGIDFAPEVAVSPLDEEQYLTFAFVRDATARDLRYSVDSSDELAPGGWTGFDPLSPVNQVERADNTPAPGLQRIVVRDPRPLNASPRRFLRLRVEQARISGLETGFDVDSGYVPGASVAGLIDPGIPGFPAWTRFNETSPASMLVSTANPASGGQAIRIQKTDTTSPAGLVLDLSESGLDFSRPEPVALRFSLALSSYSAGTGNQLQIYLGDNGTNPVAGKFWVSLVFSDGVFYLYRANSAGTGNESVSLGSASTYATPGGHIAFEIVFNPAGKTHSRVLVTGPNASRDFTDALAGAVLPWIPASPGDPARTFQLLSGTNDTLLLDFDEFSLTRAE